ncbi:hypothetical protein OP10G_1461 [Fimbriimonas ginsengisoli Gsoil 348]|uniref:Uncharacterized protein n=1 Tax=Fimbriimonas ginsengisoli Gsoil 348 TaxID=661478 RepID=A0A068NT72_FIMGI|nr:hypothetical protein OP10G_1461 [Fimbriimonas ginsengisoli Gsoil 348]
MGRTYGQLEDFVKTNAFSTCSESSSGFPENETPATGGCH